MDLDAWKIKVDKALGEMHGAMAGVLEESRAHAARTAAVGMASAEPAQDPLLVAAVTRLIEAHEAVRAADPAPGTDTLEDLNERIQSASSVFDLSRIPLGAFKSGFANLVQRLDALEKMVAKPAAEWHPGDDSLPPPNA